MHYKTDLPIALFDSGVGGLTVYKAIRELLPNENLVYLGDTARVPYGTKSRETIEKYTINAASMLLKRGAKMLVIACNTATTAALPCLRKTFKEIPIIGVVEPGAQAAAKASKNGRIAVIATEATIRSESYQNTLKRLLPRVKVAARACTLFVSLAEEGWTDGPIAEAIAARYLMDLFTASSFHPDTLLLGCTHFPLLKNTLQKIIGENACIVDSAQATAQTVKNELNLLNLHNQGHGTDQFLTTDNPERFASTGSQFLKKNLTIDQIELVEL